MITEQKREIGSMLVVEKSTALPVHRIAKAVPWQ